MNLETILRAECCAARRRFADKDDILRGVAKCAARILAGVSEDAIYQALQEREQLGSTGVGAGVALPHCRLEVVDDFVAGVFTLENPVDFEAIDNRPVRLIAFIIAPDDKPREQLRILSCFSRTLSDPDTVGELMKTTDPAELRTVFLREAAARLAPTAEEEMTLFQVLVQDEKVFSRLLDVFGPTAGTTTVVLQGQNLSAYLGRMPLFAAFWTQEPSRSCRLIMAVVNRRLANEVIRRIEEITGSLNRARGIMVTVQHLFLCAGELEL
ncbi:MAG: hypothetical protein DRP22_05230 [Verrucomicrobia bacterium]|nr:MAG: hypothetical protein DRP22_05230 [Verrucomicrobiota bacterium]